MGMCTCMSTSNSNCPLSRDSREFGDSRESREPAKCEEQRRIQPASRVSGDRDSRGSSSEKTQFVMTPSSGPECNAGGTTEAAQLGSPGAFQAATQRPPVRVPLPS